MAVPKRKKSKSRRDKRRTHQKISAPNIAYCPACQEPKLPHYACPSCDAYGDRSVEKKPSK